MGYAGCNSGRDAGADLESVVEGEEWSVGRDPPPTWEGLGVGVRPSTGKKVAIFGLK